MSTYTVYISEDSMQKFTGLTLEQAAAQLVGHDSDRLEVRFTGESYGNYTAFISEPGQDYQESCFWGDTSQDVAKKILKSEAFGKWRAMTDAEFSGEFAPDDEGD